MQLFLSSAKVRGFTLGRIVASLFVVVALSVRVVAAPSTPVFLEEIDLDAYGTEPLDIEFSSDGAAYVSMLRSRNILKIERVDDPTTEVVSVFADLSGLVAWDGLSRGPQDINILEDDSLLVWADVGNNIVGGGYFQIATSGTVESVVFSGNANRYSSGLPIGATEVLAARSIYSTVVQADAATLTPQAFSALAPDEGIRAPFRSSMLMMEQKIFFSQGLPG